MVSLPLTLIVTTRNRPRLLWQALESIASAQLMPPAIRVYVIDDGDNERSRWVAKRFGIDYWKATCGSPSKTRNFGLARVETEYVAFLDDDDALLPGAFEAQISALENRRSLAAAFTQAILVDEELRDMGALPIPTIGPKFDRDWRFFLFQDAQVACAVFRTEMLQQVGGFDPRLRYCEDSHLFARLTAQFGVIQVRGTSSLFRQRESDARDAAMRWRSFDDRRRARVLLAKQGLRLSLLDWLRWNRQERGFSSSIILQSALLAAQDGDRRRALEELTLATRVSPIHTWLSFRTLSRLGNSLVKPQVTPPPEHSRKGSP